MLNNIYIIKDEVKCLINAKRYEKFIMDEKKYLKYMEYLKEQY
jgi:hypothetical protein